MKWWILLGFVMASPGMRGQNWSLPNQGENIKNTCTDDHIKINTVPDVKAVPLNIHEFGKRVSDSPEIKLMRDAGILSCSIEIRFLLNEFGTVLCYSLEDKCHPVWEMAILKFIDCIEFGPAYKNSKPIPSELLLKYYWIFEW